MRETENKPKIKTAVLNTDGANCPSCAYSIERLGRKVEGVENVKVDASHLEIHVQYDGNPGSLERIAEIVRRLGYNAAIRRDSVT
jgi:copper chaperone CopZ